MGATTRIQSTPEQRRAADPRRSVWVTANAGTGKTRVLTDRVLRLLLSGADPEALLCLTFTKAAATEMTERIEGRLAGWAAASDPALLQDLEDLEGERPPAAMVQRARGLFATVLDLPHGLPVMTVHALATSLLRRFPLEAQVAPHFETVDERTAAELLIEAREAVLAQAAAEPLAPLARAFEALVLALSEASLTEAVREILDQRTRLAAALARFPVESEQQLERLLLAIRGALNLEPDDTAERIVERVCAEGAHDAEALLPAAQALLSGSEKTDRPRGEALLRWLAATCADRARLFEAHCGCFLKKDLTALAETKLATKKIDVRHVRALAREQGRLVEACQRLKALRVAERTTALLRVGVAALDAYENLKARRAGLDYDDLIERAHRLLERPGGADWVLFKLDRRIEHVLVDEAQDTSPSQWAIVERLVDEFFAGSGTHASTRTLFVVGDEKQSIYSFQGADLAGFRAVRARLRERALPALEEVGIELSFRSSPAVLDCVDAVFADPEARAGVIELDHALRHQPFRRNDAGTVEVWPLVAPPERAGDDEPWPLPDVQRFTEDAPYLLAQAIARRVQRWIAGGELLESQGRPIRAGDVLILLNRRGVLQELLIRALRREGLPVAGADRLSLTGHIAVQDLMALGRVALLPEDDLSLAALLKSPLLGLDEAHLFELAYDRGGASLLERLRAFAATKPAPFGAAYERLAAWLRRADFMPPFEFFGSVLNEPDGTGRSTRELILARLGPEAAEPIEAFLGQTLAYESGHPASLQGFMRWLELGASELKRDAEQAGDAVRVMTVHGAKGLEAPIVILADAGPYGEPNATRLVWDDVHELPFWRGRQGERDDRTDRLCERERLRAQDERRRLLYVALTRARDRLYIAGCAGRKQSGENGKQLSWHDHVVRSLARLADVEELSLEPPFAGSGWSYRRGIPAAAWSSTPQTDVPPPIPAWLRRPVPSETAPVAPLAPSRLGDGSDPRDGDPRGGEGDALAVGSLVHRLLELLPGLPIPEREAAMQRFIQARARGLDEATLVRVVEAARRILAHPDLADVFGPDARAEQAIAGQLHGVTVSGQIDRMVISGRAITVIDFKTNRRPPSSPTEAPIAYRRQMAVYRALLGTIYPSHDIRCALVWTETGHVMWLPADVLTADLEQLGTP